MSILGANWHSNFFKWLAGGLVVLALAACNRAETPSPNPSPTQLAIQTETTSPPPPTATATPSSTPAPSATARSTETRPPAASPTPTRSPTAVTPTARPTAGDFTPQAVSVWDTAFVGGDNMSGTCANPVTPVYGLVQITPQGDSLGWKNQEPAPYAFSRVRANVWQYSGPTSTGDGSVTLTVTFTSPTTLRLTRAFVASAEPNCTHTHQYTGTFKFFRP